MPGWRGGKGSIYVYMCMYMCKNHANTRFWGGGGGWEWGGIPLGGEGGGCGGPGTGLIYIYIYMWYPHLRHASKALACCSSFSFQCFWQYISHHQAWVLCRSMAKKRCENVRPSNPRFSKRDSYQKATCAVTTHWCSFGHAYSRRAPSMHFARSRAPASDDPQSRHGTATNSANL